MKPNHRLLSLALASALPDRVHQRWRRRHKLWRMQADSSNPVPVSKESFRLLKNPA